MKRLLLHDAIVAAGALLLWACMVVVEVKFRELSFFKNVFWASLLILLGAFPSVALVTLRKQPSVALMGALLSFLMAPVFILGGVYVVCCFKMALGGYPS